MQDPGSQQVELCSTIHLTLEEFQSVDLAFNLPAARAELKIRIIAYASHRQVFGIAFTFRWNPRSRCAGNRDHERPEYATNLLHRNFA
jgi:hypothetical protein